MALSLRTLPIVGPLALWLVVGCGPDATTAPNVPASSGATTTEPGPASGPDASSGSADETGTKTLFVREVQADCEGEGPRKCLQVRESESADWMLFYAPIEGFTYEEGTKYELRVSVEKNPQPMADASSLKYALVEIVSQQKVGKGK
jgi:hypothetical protein